MSARFGKLGWVWLSAVVFVIDQITKYWFDNNLQMWERITVIPHVLDWTLAYNLSLIHI